MGQFSLNKTQAKQKKHLLIYKGPKLLSPPIFKTPSGKFHAGFLKFHKKRRNNYIIAHLHCTFKLLNSQI